MSDNDAAPTYSQPGRIMLNGETILVAGGMTIEQTFPETKTLARGLSGFPGKGSITVKLEGAEANANLFESLSGMLRKAEQEQKRAHRHWCDVCDKVVPCRICKGQSYHPVRDGVTCFGATARTSDRNLVACKCRVGRTHSHKRGERRRARHVAMWIAMFKTQPANVRKKFDRMLRMGDLRNVTMPRATGNPVLEALARDVYAEKRAEALEVLADLVTYSREVMQRRHGDDELAAREVDHDLRRRWAPCGPEPMRSVLWDRDPSRSLHIAETTHGVRAGLRDLSMRLALRSLDGLPPEPSDPTIREPKRTKGIAPMIYTECTAEVSSCGRFRTRLTRGWFKPGDAKRTCVFVLLNPSVADGREDDPTVRRCVGFAAAKDCNRLVIVNMFAFRATSPADMFAALARGEDVVGANDVGELNPDIVNAEVVAGDLVIVGWGSHKATRNMVVFRGSAAQCQMYALKINDDGAPGHPLYLPKSSKLVSWPRGPMPPAL